MHKEICLVHISLDERLILLAVPSAYYQIILAGYEPNEFFKPEHLAHDILQLRLLKLRQVSRCGCFSLLDCNIGSVLGLYLLSIGLLLDFEILFNV